MEEKRSWGALWTYAVFFAGALILTGIIWALVEERRDWDAKSFYEVSADNYTQLSKVSGYVLAMDNSQAKTDLSAMLDTIHIIRTRKEVEDLKAIAADTIPPVVTDSIPFSEPNLTGLIFKSTTDRTIRFNENIVSATAIMEPISTEVGQVYTYKIVPRDNNDDGALFNIVDNKFILSIAPDYENPVDTNTNNIYACDVVVTSSTGATYREDMVFYINDVIDESVSVVPENIIDSVWTMNYSKTWMTVRVLNLKEVKCQAVALYGTQSGVYTHTGRKEESFNWHSHHLRIGNVTPLVPNTLYYIKVNAWDEQGNKYEYPEISGRSLN